MKRAFAVFVDLHACRQEIVVKHRGGEARGRHIGLTLQNKPDLDAALCRAAQVPQQVIAWKEVGVRYGDLLAGGANADSIVLFNVTRVLIVIPLDPRGDDTARPWRFTPLLAPS